MNGLAEYERARMGRLIGVQPRTAVFASIWSFRWLLLLAWIGTAVIAAAVLIFDPGFLFPANYQLPMIVLGTVLWFGVAAARVLRTAESVLLQSAGEFRPLANASVISAVVSAVAVAVLVPWVGVLWSIAGIMLGELVYALFIWKALLGWLRADPGSAK